jgi:hypothetical protein
MMKGATDVPRTMLAVFCTALLVVMAVGAHAALPASVDAFAAGLEGTGDPEVAAEMFFTAAYVYTTADTGLGGKMLDEIMAADDWKRGAPTLVSALDETPWVFASYAKGTDPADAYAGLDPDNFALDVAGVDTLTDGLMGTGDLAVVELHSTGADTPRPLVLQSVEGKYKVASASPLCFGLQSADGHPGEDIAATTTMGGTLHLWLEATYLWMIGLQSEGQFMLSEMLPPEGIQNDITKMLAVAKEKPWILFSYAQGTSYEDGYAGVNPFSFTIKITREEKLGENQKAFVECTGADNPRPFQCKVTKRNQYRMYEFSTLRVECRPPAKERW